MVCYHPIKAFHEPGSGKKPNFRYSPGLTKVDLPCGQCIGCRIDRSRQWAARCVHEASLHSENSFITLTYDDAHIPENFSLVKKHFQDFMKRLRYYYSDKKIRYYYCGEYGDTYGRPHYHALLFGIDFPDKKLCQERKGIKLYISEGLQRVWDFGFSSIGDVNYQTAAYVARYCMKKVTGKKADEHYSFVDPETGEIIQRLPEFACMSRRSGIGKDWIEKYFSDVYPSDSVVIMGPKGPHCVKPPRYYDTYLEHIDPDVFVSIKNRRLERALGCAKDGTKSRLLVREKVQEAKLSSLVRVVD